MISIPNRRRRLLFCGATVKQDHERLEQGALTLGALAVLTAIWLGIGLPSLPSVFSHHGAYENESPLVAYTNDPAQPRPHAAPSSPLGKIKAVRRQGGKPAPHLVQATSASGQRTMAATAAPSGAVQPRLEAAAPKQASAAAPARDAAAQPAAPQAAAPPETVAAPRATTTVATTSTTTTTQTSTSETPGTPPPPVTVPSLPDLPDLPDLPLPNVPLPPVPPVPTVEVPPLPAVEPPSQLPPVPAPTQTLPNLP